jgi:hypothetical protein
MPVKLGIHCSFAGFGSLFPLQPLPQTRDYSGQGNGDPNNMVVTGRALLQLQEQQEHRPGPAC